MNYPELYQYAKAAIADAGDTVFVSKYAENAPLLGAFVIAKTVQTFGVFVDTGAGLGSIINRPDDFFKDVTRAILIAPDLVESLELFDILIYSGKQYSITKAQLLQPTNVPLIIALGLVE